VSASLLRPLMSQLYHPRMINERIQRLWNDTWQDKTEVLGEKPSQCHYVHTVLIDFSGFELWLPGMRNRLLFALTMARSG
jgi:hypothetical protein